MRKNVEILQGIFPEIKRINVMGKDRYRATLYFNINLGLTNIRFEATSEKSNLYVRNIWGV